VRARLLWKTTISLTAPAGDTVYVTTSPTGKVDVVENYNDIGSTLPSGSTNDNVTITMKSDSTFKLTMTFNDTGTYTVKAKDIVTGKSATVDITVSDAVVTVDAPTTAVIGEKATITGTVTGYEGATVVIKDSADNIKVWTYDAKDSADVYEYKWDTANMLPGTYRIYIYASNVNLSSLSGVSADEATSILLVEGDLAVTAPEVTAKTDTTTMKIEGVAKGATQVYMLVFRNDNGNCEYNGTVSVDSDDWTFEKKPFGSELTKGTYTVFVIHPGRDGALAEASAAYSTTSTTRPNNLVATT